MNQKASMKILTMTKVRRLLHKYHRKQIRKKRKRCEKLKLKINTRFVFKIQNFFFFQFQKSKKTSDDQQPTNDKSGFEFKSSDITEEELLACATSQKIPTNDNLSRLFNIQTKFLSYENEMVRMFGAKIVQSERQKSTNRNDSKFNFKNRIVNHKTTWPPFQKSGMKFIYNSNSIRNKIFISLL